MTGLVHELQREALDAVVPTADLLRKALVTARKLKVKDIQSWLHSELNGYSKYEDIPEYRSLSGEIRAFNLYNGIWMPVMFPESMADLQRSLSNRKCFQSVAELESLLASEKGILNIPFSPEVSARLRNAISSSWDPTLIVSATKLAGILDATRNAVLEWALQLEEQGVTGQNFSFSKGRESGMAMAGPVG